jgi:hypothetical protein
VFHAFLQAAASRSRPIVPEIVPVPTRTA